MRSHASAHETICNDAITGQRKTAIFLGVEIFSKSGRNGLERMQIFLMHLFFGRRGGGVQFGYLGKCQKLFANYKFPNYLKPFDDAGFGKFTSKNYKYHAMSLSLFK